MEGTSLVVKRLRSLFPLQKARVRPLVEEPDFVILHVTPYNQREKKEKMTPLLRYILDKSNAMLDKC